MKVLNSHSTIMDSKHSQQQQNVTPFVTSVSYQLLSLPPIDAEYSE